MTDTVESLEKIRLLKLGLFGFYNPTDDDYNILIGDRVYYWFSRGQYIHSVSTAPDDEDDVFTVQGMAEVMKKPIYRVIDDSLVYEELSEIIHVQSLQKDKTP